MPPSGRRRRRLCRERWRLATSGVFVLATCALAFDVASQYSWRARTTIAVVPTPRAVEDAQAYDFDVLSRSSIMPTYAAVIDRSGAGSVRRVVAGTGEDPSDYDLHAVGIATAGATCTA